MFFLPKVIILDFEIAAINAFQSYFPDVDIELCHFHWAQSFFRQIANYGLKPSYSNHDSDVGNWLKLFFGLPLLPAHDVEEFMANASQDTEVEKFCDYVCDTLHQTVVFLRVCRPGCPTTLKSQQKPTARKHFINISKSVSSPLTPKFMFWHRSCWVLQEETYVKLQGQNRQRNQRAATVQRRERIEEICQMYRSGQLTRAQYVHQISFKFLPLQV